MKQHLRLSSILFLLLTGMLLSTCGLFHPALPASTARNLPPETHISLYYPADTTLGPGDYWTHNGDTVMVEDTLILGLDTTVSVQTVHWWGDDPDGEVIGYYIQWSYMDTAVFVQEETQTFYLPLRSQFDIYSLKVWAVDNDTLSDPTAAIASFPVYNSKPEVEWKLNSLPSASADTSDIHKSFTHHSFFWDVTDIDGQETITDIYYALDDTSSWNHLDGEIRSIMLTELDPGTHRIFLKVKDVAGAESDMISFPDPQDDERPNHWLVTEPVGDVLIVNDFQGDQSLYKHQTLYEGVFTSLVGANGYSVWEIGGNSTNTVNSVPYAAEDIEKNLSSFSKVFWYTFRGENSLNESALALTRFVSDGGILFMNNAQKATTTPDTTWTFTSIDSVYQYSNTGRIYGGTNLQASWGDTSYNTPLELQVSSTIADKLWAIIPGSNSELRYQFEPDSLNTSDYSGTPPIMIETPINLGSCFYMSIPLYYCNGNDNIDDLFKHIFEIDD